MSDHYFPNRIFKILLCIFADKINIQLYNYETINEKTITLLLNKLKVIWYVWQGTDIQHIIFGTI
tara:strand:+ start:424 stop:618 length:195 start_codon:yes stop_codon:yes gene_type:complete